MHFQIAHPWVFLLIPLPLLIYLLLPPVHKRRSAIIAPFLERAAAISGHKPRRAAWVAKRGAIQWTVLLLCWTLLLAAAASPQWVGQPAKRAKTVRNFLIVADISFSMATTDWVVGGRRMSRWDAVRSVMRDFVKNRHSDQIGLVMFGSNAYLQAPLTNDLASIEWLMEETEVGMAGQMTSLGQAIAFSGKILQEDTIKQKIMLLLTDGIDAGQDILPLDAAHQARRDSIVIFTLGIGRAGTGRGGYILDERTLKEIAKATGGEYFNAMSEGELKHVYKTLDKLQPVQYDEETYKPVVLLYYYPLAAAVLLGMLACMVGGLLRLF